MKILAIEKENEVTKLPDDYTIILYDEAIAVWELYKKGIVREIYFTEDKNAVLILECANKMEALNYLNQLPLIEKKLISFEVLELNPYTGFERLFGK